MRYVLAMVLLALTAPPAIAQSSLQLTWRHEEDVFEDPQHEEVARVAFKLTNRGAKPLPAHGWAIYFDAMHEPIAGSVQGGFTLERVTGRFQRLAPGPAFAGLAPGQSVEIEYRTGLITNISFAPVGPYVVFDDEPDKGQPLAYTAVPFERPPQPGREPRVITPQAQFALDSVVKDIKMEALPPVLPTPVSVEKREGELDLAVLPAIAAGPDLQAESGLAAEYLAPHLPGPKARSKGAPSALRLETGMVEGHDSPEAYELVIDSAAGIRIVGNSAAGAFYGLQSLRSLLPTVATGTGVRLPALRIVDAPRFGYRGLLLDVARNFQPKAQVLRVLDLMARYKLNVLHFHLTDDEGWRIEMPSLPELTAVGARRGHTLDSKSHLPPAYGSGPEVDRPYGSGFYTRADYAEILRYAAARHIEVVPEFEMPGHARAAIKAMEARARALRDKGDAAGATQYLLSDPQDESVYTSAQLYHDNVMNPALPSTYAFIGRVVQDLVGIHREAGIPLRNLHMGGDEVPEGVWQRSPAVAAYLKEHGLRSVDELWYVFCGRVAEILKEHGVQLSGWEEIGLRSTRLDGRPKMIPNPDFVGRGWRAYVWNNVPGSGAEDLGYRLANGGFKVVLCPVTNIYFDLAWNQNPEEAGLHWGGYIDLKKPFEFIPFDYYRSVRLDSLNNPIDPAVFVGKDRLTEYGQANILGIQGNLWSETLGGEGRLDYMLLPKLLGLAERAWAPDPDWARERDQTKADALFLDAWSVFVNVVGKHELPRLDRERPAWNYRIPKPGLLLVDGQVHCNLEIPGFVLRYTDNGSDPTVKSPEVRRPIPLTSEVRVAAFDTNGRKGHTATLIAP